MSPKMIKDVHNLRPSGLRPATREERTCPEPDYDRNEDACAASSSDTRRLPQAASVADQQLLQHMQDDVDQLKELTSTFEADVKNTFREVANNQEEHDQDFKKIRVQIKNLHRDVCRIRGNAPTAPRNVQVSMDICCGCAGPIPQEEDGTPGGIPCAGCRHRLCGIWCIVENAGQGPRCKHCTRMAPKVSGTPDGGALVRLGSAVDNPCRHGERTFDDAFEPTLRTQSAECPCYICEKYTRFQLVRKACEWLTCPMCERISWKLRTTNGI